MSLRWKIVDDGSRSGRVVLQELVKVNDGESLSLEWRDIPVVGKNDQEIPYADVAFYDVDNIVR